MSGANVTAVGGDLSLVYTGTSGVISYPAMTLSGGCGGGPSHTYEEYHDEYEKTVNRLKHSLFTIKVYEREINRATDLATIEALENEITLTQRDAMIWHQFATKIMHQAIDSGFNTSSWSPLPALPWLGG